MDSNNPTTFNWSENVGSSWTAFYTRLFADCRAQGLKPWTGNPMTWAGELYQLTKVTATDDEIVDEVSLDNIKANGVDPFNATLDDMRYGMNPEEILMHLEDQPRVVPFKRRKARRTNSIHYFQHAA
jgi:hypothetical protein